jgi:GTP-binding protein
MSRLWEARFIRAAGDWTDLPPDAGIEVAFVGRSNAGKSTAINAIVQRRIAHVSKTPGRTRTINFFSLASGARLVDLPGYGYAAVPLSEREHWGELVSGYLQRRTALRGIVLIIDARHVLTPLDRQLLGWLVPSGKPLHVLLAKADKLARGKAREALDKASREFAALPLPATVQLFSGVTGLGVPAAQNVIRAWLNKKPPVKGE